VLFLPITICKPWFQQKSEKGGFQEQTVTSRNQPNAVSLYKDEAIISFYHRNAICLSHLVQSICSECGVTAEGRSLPSKGGWVGAGIIGNSEMPACGGTPHGMGVREVVILGHCILTPKVGASKRRI